MTKFLDFLVLPTYKVSSRSEKKKGRRRRGIIIIIIIILTKIRIFTIVMVKINTRPPSVSDRRESSPSSPVQILAI